MPRRSHKTNPNEETSRLRSSAVRRFSFSSILVILFILLVSIVLISPLKNKISHSFQSKFIEAYALTSDMPVGQNGDWAQIFNDEFDGTTLDTSKWTVCYPWDNNGCTNDGNNELEWYMPNDVIINNGILRLKAEKRTIAASDGKTYNYTAGMVTTGRNKWDTSIPAKFKFQYGYIEMKAKVPQGKGLWPAFWLLPFSDTDPGKWPPEIDVMEILCQQTNTTYMTIHWLASDGSYSHIGGSWTGPDFATDWHIFAVDWEPGVIIWYVDGVERYRYTSHIPTEPMYVLANLAVGGNWPGSPDATTVFPAYYDIDYIRVWKKGIIATLTPTRTPTPTPIRTPTPTPTVILCARKGEGDANCDGVINILDFETWRREFLGIDTTTKADFDSSGGVTILDFEIWRRGFLGL